MGLPKIIFINRYFHPDQSATSQLLTDLARGLSESGLNVHVICSRQRYDDATAGLPSTELIGEVRVHRVWTATFGRQRLSGRAFDYATFYFSSAIAMFRLVGRGDTVIAETDPPLISIVAAAVAKLKHARLINWLQDIFPEVATLLDVNPLPRVLDRLLRRCRNWSLRSAHANVVLGDRMRDRLLGMGLAPRKIRTVANWAERHPSRPMPVGASALRSSLGVADEFLVGYSGNLGRAHEFETVLGAAEILHDDERVLFLMIGGGAGMSRLMSTVADRGLRNFRFLPYQPRETLSDSLAAADVHWVSLLPALEGLIVPSKYYGILAAARPVIFIGDADGELARDILTSGAGAVIGSGDSAALATLIGTWKSNSAKLEWMGAQGLAHYHRRYAAERALEAWKIILETTVCPDPVRARPSAP